MQELEPFESQLKTAARLNQLYRVTHYKGERTDAAGHTGIVDIEIWETAEDVPTTPRFFVYAHDAFGRGASSNGADDLRLEIGSVHWGELDAEPHDDAGERQAGA